MKWPIDVVDAWSVLYPLLNRYWLHPFSGSGFCLQPQVYSFLFFFFMFFTHYFFLFYFLSLFPVCRTPLFAGWVSAWPVGFPRFIHLSFSLSTQSIWKRRSQEIKIIIIFIKKRSNQTRSEKQTERDKMWIPDIPQLFAADCILQPGLCTAVTKMGSIVFPWRMEMFTRPLTVVCSPYSFI